MNEYSFLYTKPYDYFLPKATHITYIKAKSYKNALNNFKKKHDFIYVIQEVYRRIK